MSSDFLFEISRESIRTFSVIIAFIYITSRFTIFQKIIDNELVTTRKKLFYLIYFSFFSIFTIIFPFEYKGTSLCSFRAASPILGGIFGGKGVGFGVALIGGGFRLIYLDSPEEWPLIIPMFVAAGIAELWQEDEYRPKEILQKSIYILLLYQAMHLFLVYLGLDRDIDIWFGVFPLHSLVFFVNLFGILIFLGITEELKRREEHMGVLQDLALTDEMTKTFNYRYFKSFLNEQLKQCDINKKDNVSLLFLDLDNFKDYNDTYGHQDGDELLKEIANLFRRSIRPKDVMCRYGGDEFAIVLPDTSGKIAFNVAERLRQRLKQKNYSIRGTNKLVTISIGIASYQEGMTADELLEAADEALYQAKEKGKDTICLHKTCY
ncbi:GGDEF domain-containing protein [Natranaerofaba carboxydovora]|uniref:GGDEF domain-containing protein n=1 Tax=Natranaerofaba carboxydovora TaxID=2742683 RepID=UPI001F14496C|nr:GGDEF domain-containing protein [Natranaerofaba carboxydovora]